MNQTSNKHRSGSQQSNYQNFKKVQPQAIDLERAVLGALMIDKDAFSLVYEWLTPESFYEPRHQVIYDTIRELFINRMPVDILTVNDQLQKKGKSEEIGGPAYIAELSSWVASSANIEYHARVVAQKYLFRQFISLASEIEKQAFDEMTDCDDLMQYAESKIFELAQRNVKRDFSPLDVALKESNDKLMRAYSNKGELTGIPSGFYRLDEITNGWQLSDFIVIAGRPAMGKTSFALCLLKNAAIDRGIPSAFFSLEMSMVQLADRLISNAANIESSKINKGQLSEIELSRYDKTLGSLYGAPVYIDDTPGLSILELRTKARRLVREKGVRIIFIDYLQLMNGKEGRYSSREQEVSTISRSLKGLAKELNTPIIALSQLNRGVENREGLEGKRPQLSDLRESGSIEQDADMVLFVNRPEYYHIYQDENGRDLHGMAQIIIAKHRKGATVDVLLKFKGEYTRFENPEDCSLDHMRRSRLSRIP